MTTRRPDRTLPGLGSVTVGATDRHPALVWVAAGGLVAALMLGAFGMPPIEVHFPTHRLGIMGPLCGMTRSVARAAVGDLPAGWRYNPGGVVLVAGAWTAIGRTVIGRVTGRWLNVDLVVPWGWWTMATVLVGLTINQQLHAELLA